MGSGKFSLHFHQGNALKMCTQGENSKFHGSPSSGREGKSSSTIADCNPGQSD